jgi:hypothetical protein
MSKTIKCKVRLFKIQKSHVRSAIGQFFISKSLDQSYWSSHPLFFKTCFTKKYRNSPALPFPNYWRVMNTNLKLKCLSEMCFLVLEKKKPLLQKSMFSFKHNINIKLFQLILTKHMNIHMLWKCWKNINTNIFPQMPVKSDRIDIYSMQIFVKIFVDITERGKYLQGVVIEIP